MNRFEKYLFGIGTLFAGAALCFHLAGCASTSAKDGASVKASTNGIPNLRLVEKSIYRGGQPDLAGWKWLKSAGVSNVVKLNEQDEASDKQAVALGMKLNYFPIDTMQQLITGPDPVAMSNAVARIGPGTYVHCEHGEDRTGEAVGFYRLKEGTNAAAAWSEMVKNGFHPALLGLTRFWEAHSR
jgi:protein tyrosine phosphatase (PTP) superfamily phosphohydrolase (DUF442 family)